MEIAPGSHFDRYEVLSVLGVGGMGEVYLANDTRLGRKVAFKTLPTQYTTDAERVHRFEQEARAASALNHPNIVTIFDIGAVNGLHFMAAEYIEGESLRERLQRTKPTLNEALDWAIQTASALASAHAAGIVHRDIKPDNLMLRGDGAVKVLDFGLAKLTEEAKPAVDSEAVTLQKIMTDPGAVLGTPQYMSPEQARGQKADARSDIFSLGVVLYEMLAARPPFEGANAIEVMGSILKSEPAPLKAALVEAPEALAHELERIVTKTLRKERDERYSSAKELLSELKQFRDELQFESKLAQKRNSQEPALQNGERERPATVASAPVAAVQVAHAPRSVLRRVALPALALIIIATVAVFFYFKRQPVLTDKDTILLADFENTTGDAVFDGALKQALAVQLRQTPFLNLFSDERVRDTLRYMGKPANEKITREVGREMCIRQQLKALLLGSIVSIGRNYVITLEAISSQNGETFAQLQTEADGKEQVLKAIGQLAREMREKLGESLNSIQKYDAPIRQATTSSLEALKVYSQGWEESRMGRNRESVPILSRAVEIDPNFAMAWGALAMQARNWKPEIAKDAAQKAFDLRSRASEYEKQLIESIYYTTRGDNDKATEALETMIRTYPRDATAWNNLGTRYAAAGRNDQAAEKYRKATILDPGFALAYRNLAGVLSRLQHYDEAIENFRESIRRSPDTPLTYQQLGNLLVSLNRFDEAKQVYEQALALKLDLPNIQRDLFVIASVKDDSVTMQHLLDEAATKVNDPAQLFWQADAAAFYGQLARAHKTMNRFAEVSARLNQKEIGETNIALAAEWAALFGKCQQAREILKPLTSLTQSEARFRHAEAVRIFCGEAAQAQSLITEMAKKFPQDTIVNEVDIPFMQAAIAIQNGNFGQGLQILQKVSRYENQSNFFYNHLRGQAYLGERNGAAAAREFQTILDHRGWAPTSPLYPLAHLGLARAAVLQGDAAKAKQSYDEFFKLWKDADADLPVLIEAKQEYAKLK